MKKIHYILLAAGSLFLASCNDFLTEEPESIISEEQYYKTETDALTAINAVYFFLNSGRIQTPYNTLFNTGMNMGSDDEDPGPGATNPDVRSLAVQSHSSSNLRIYEIWQQHYAAIRKANVVLDKIQGITFSIPATKDRILGEAKFLRALFYFNLVRLYGDVPLITEYQNYVSSAEYAIPKSPSADVYAQIEKDLTEAASVLPGSYSSPDAGRATAGASKALLAKVYLIKASLPLKLTENYQKAIAKTEEVLSAADGGTGTYGYNLAGDYSRVFLPAFKNGTEHIFSAQMKANSYSQGNNEATRAIYPAIPGLNGTYAHMVRFYTEGNDKYFSIYKLFKPTDKRRNVTFVKSFTSPANGRKYGLALVNTTVPNDSTPFWNKWWDPNNQAVTTNSESNVPIIRYAEILLIHAEAENEVNGPTAKAYKSINSIRTRAGLANLTPGLSKDQFRDSVYFERRLELTYEYQRWFDLIREKDAGGRGILIKSLQKVGKNNATEKHYLYPIPQTELDNNPLLKQNPLWE